MWLRPKSVPRRPATRYPRVPRAGRERPSRARLDSGLGHRPWPGSETGRCGWPTQCHEAEGRHVRSHFGHGRAMQREGYVVSAGFPQHPSGAGHRAAPVVRFPPQRGCLRPDTRRWKSHSLTATQWSASGARDVTSTGHRQTSFSDSSCPQPRGARGGAGRLRVRCGPRAESDTMPLGGGIFAISDSAITVCEVSEHPMPRTVRPTRTGHSAGAAGGSSGLDFRPHPSQQRAPGARYGPAGRSSSHRTRASE